MRLPHLKILRLPQEQIALPLSPNTIEAPRDPDPYAVYPPFMSRLEVAVWQFIETQSPYWELQVQEGRPRERGSTRVDFLNQMLMVALYPDGEYFHRYRTARDVYARSLLMARGYKVIQWLVSETVEEFVPKIPELYRRDVGG